MSETQEFEDVLRKFPVILGEVIKQEANYVYNGKIRHEKGYEKVIIKFIQLVDAREIKIIREFNQIDIDINIPEILYYDPIPVIFHTNIDGGTIDEKFNGGWYVQKYIEGVDLYHVPLKYVKTAFLLAIDVLEKIHASGFIHGDTHGENFIYSIPNNKIYIIDFESTYSYKGDKRFPNLIEEDIDDAYKIIRTFMCYIAGTSWMSFWEVEYGNIIGDPKKNIADSVIKMTNKLTDQTTLNEFKILLENMDL
jgi:tRNA A-37 threonylcarbamoyl transferase component Bud32